MPFHMLYRCTADRKNPLVWCKLQKDFELFTTDLHLNFQLSTASEP